MQSDKTCSDIVSALVTTRTEANVLLSEVDILLRSIYMVGDGNFKQTLENGVRSQTALTISKYIEEKKEEELLKGIKEKINSLDYVGLTIAFDPNLEVTRKIVGWVRQNIDKDLMLDININKSILGGAIIEYKGKVVSFTIKTKVDEYFLNNVNI